MIKDTADPHAPVVAAHSDFSQQWLGLRECADHRARDQHDLLSYCRQWLYLINDADSGLRLLDLGCGSGNNLRYLNPRLPAPQHWILLDQDSALLTHARQSTVLDHHNVASLSCLERDLARPGEALAGIERPDIVTASALLDLVSPAWLQALADWCSQQHSAVWLAMSINGDNAILSLEAESDSALSEMDLRVQGLIARHQQRDKGFDGALGALAPDAAQRIFEATGFEVFTASAPWQLDCREREQAALASALLEGWYEAALEQAPEAHDALADWHRHRQSDVRAGRISIRVGHTDLLALPEHSGDRRA